MVVAGMARVSVSQFLHDQYMECGRIVDKVGAAPAGNPGFACLQFVDVVVVCYYYFIFISVLFCVRVSVCKSMTNSRRRRRCVNRQISLSLSCVVFSIVCRYTVDSFHPLECTDTVDDNGCMETNYT